MMLKKQYSFLIILFLSAIFLHKLHVLYAGTKYLGEYYDAAYNSTPQSTRCIGDFDVIFPADSATNQIHWLTKKLTTMIHRSLETLANKYPFGHTRAITAEGSPGAVHMWDDYFIYYICGGIDQNSASAKQDYPLSSYQRYNIHHSIWGEGRDVMTNYTHLGFYLYASTSTLTYPDFKVVLTEVDLMDTRHNQKGNQYYWQIDDNADSFPAGFVSIGPEDWDYDGVADAQFEEWMVRLPVNWRGWKFFLLRLGRVGGVMDPADTQLDYLYEDRRGDFSPMATEFIGAIPRPPFVGDGRFNIREIRGQFGNPHPVDDGDSWYCVGSELRTHYLGTLPVDTQDYWYKGDVEGLKSIAFYSTYTPFGGFHIYLDNVMFTTPIPSGGTDTMRVDYAWLGDGPQELSSDKVFPHPNPFLTSRYWHDLSNPGTMHPADLAMTSHDASRSIKVFGYPPPTISAKFSGDISDTMSRISVTWPPPWWGTFLNDFATGPYFYGKGQVGGKSYSDGNEWIFTSMVNAWLPPGYPSPDPGPFATIFITPRSADGDDTHASYGYPQVINLHYDLPKQKTRILQSENLMRSEEE